jgi:hypothetical protein
MLAGAIREQIMAFIFARKHKNSKTWYVGYYYNGRLIRRKVGRSKTLARKVQGDIEAKIERADVGLLNKDYPKTRDLKAS